jgi:hypothetical protein
MYRLAAIHSGYDRSQFWLSDAANLESMILIHYFESTRRHFPILDAADGPVELAELLNDSPTSRLAAPLSHHHLWAVYYLIVF